MTKKKKSLGQLIDAYKKALSENEDKAYGAAKELLKKLEEKK